MKATQTKMRPAACAHCGYVVDCATGQGQAVPKPGDLTLCIQCGGLNQFTGAMGLRAFDEAGLDPENAANIARARKALAEARYARVVDRLDALLGAHLTTYVDLPRFALPAPEIAIIGDLGDTGMTFARNASARAFLAKAVQKDTPSADRPTVAMLRAVLEARGIAVESVTLGELGLTPLGVKPGGPS